MARGGFFKKIFKGVKNIVKAVSKVPVLGAVAKAAVGSLPVVGQVVTAVNAFKGKTAQGVAATPVGGVVSPGQVLNATVNRSTGRRRRPKVAKRAKRGRAKRAKRAKRSGGGTAKQRAARARFAAAARKGKIRKGQRL